MNIDDILYLTLQLSIESIRFEEHGEIGFNNFNL